jgi:hypothetical protein
VTGLPACCGRRLLPVGEGTPGVVVEPVGLLAEIETRLRTEANWLFNLIQQVCSV